MKKIFLPLCCLLMVVYSCNKKTSCTSPTTVAPQAEIDSIQNYLTSKGLTATKDSRGFFYNISNAGTGDKPTQCSYVYVDYIGRRTNDSVFDRSTYISGFQLSKVVLGWQESIPLIAKGGKMTVYIPPTLGYGATASGSIPANSILIFDVNLVNF